MTKTAPFTSANEIYSPSSAMHNFSFLWMKSHFCHHEKKHLLIRSFSLCGQTSVSNLAFEILAESLSAYNDVTMFILLCFTERIFPKVWYIHMY